MENRIYECTTEFEISKWDSDNDCFSDEVMTVEKGSVWECTGKGFVCDGENRLEDIDSGAWIEVSNETLDVYFKDITADNEEMATNEYLRSGY